MEEKNEKTLDTLERMDKKLGKIENYSESRTKYSNKYSALRSKYEKKMLAIRNLEELEGSMARISLYIYVFTFMFLGISFMILFSMTTSFSMEEMISFYIEEIMIGLLMLFLMFFIIAIVYNFYESPGYKIWAKRMLETEILYRREFKERVLNKPFEPYNILLKNSRLLLAISALLFIIFLAVKLGNISFPFADLITGLIGLVSLTTIIISIVFFKSYKYYKNMMMEIREELIKE